MRDKPLIYLGLAVFLILVTFPFWYDAITGTQAREALVLPKVKGATECVRPVDEIRRDHMQLLLEWRQEVVRDNDRYFDFNGVKTEKSIDHTCMKCHENRKKFCDKCHDYVSVKPYCWDCHVGTRASGGK